VSSFRLPGFFFWDRWRGGGGTRDSNLWLHRGKVSYFPMGGRVNNKHGGGGVPHNHGGVGTPDMVHLDVGEKISEGGKIGWTMGKSK
jgi:hypothetical protein